LASGGTKCDESQHFPSGGKTTTPHGGGKSPNLKKMREGGETKTEGKVDSWYDAPGQNLTLRGEEISQLLQ